MYERELFTVAIEPDDDDVLLGPSELPVESESELSFPFFSGFFDLLVLRSDLEPNVGGDDDGGGTSN